MQSHANTIGISGTRLRRSRSGALNRVNKGDEKVACGDDWNTAAESPLRKGEILEEHEEVFCLGHVRR